MTGRNSKDKKHCKKWSTVRRHLILFAQKHIKIVQFLHKAPPCNGQVCILCCTSGPLARTAPPGGRRDRRPASPASTHSSHLRASPSSFPPLPPKSMLGGVAWAPGAMLPRPRPSFPTLISGGARGARRFETFALVNRQFGGRSWSTRERTGSAEDAGGVR